MTQTTPTDEEADIYAQSFARDGDKSKAFRKTFPNSKAKPESVHVNANKFHNMPKVSLRVDEVKSIAAEIADQVYGITAESLIKDLAEIKDKALDGGQFGPSVSAVMGQAKLCGFDVQKIEVNVSGEISVSERVMMAKQRARESLERSH